MLAHLLVAQARERPDAAALVAGGATLSWSALRERSDALASGLAAQGLQPGDRVAFLLPNCPEFVVGLLAVARLRRGGLPARDSEINRTGDSG